MPGPAPPSVLAAFTAFVRQLINPRQAPRNVSMVIVAAADTFAPTAQARARLLRQAHASGLLSGGEVDRALGGTTRSALDTAAEGAATGHAQNERTLGAPGS